MTAVGENIKNIRKKLGITQEELSEKLSVTRQAVSNWENGKTEPDIETLTKIAQIFDISIDELVDGIPKGITELRGKKNYLRTGIVFSVIFVLFLILFIIFEPIADKYHNLYYIGMPKMILNFLVLPTMIVCGSAALTFLITYSTGVHIKNKNLRIAFLAIGIVLLLLTTIYQYYIFVSYLIAHFFGRGPKLFLGIQHYMFIVSYPLIHAISPIFSSLGLIKK